MQKNIFIAISAVLIMFSMLLAGCSMQASNANTMQGDTLTIKVLDVGQGDAILIKTPDKQNILIDTSDIEEQGKLKKALEQEKITRLDKLILTHPHADHIGGMEMLLANYEIGVIYDNGMPSTSKLYLNYMKKIKSMNITRQALKEGDVLNLGEGIIFRVFAPNADLVAKGTKKGYQHDPNNESVVGQLVYNNFKMLFTGDAEKDEEKVILQSQDGNALQSQILKTGHHGSKSSSSADFLRSVQPETAVISCGVGNSYGHPHKETMKKYNLLKLNIFETDKNGTITIETDGTLYSVIPEKGEER